MEASNYRCELGEMGRDEEEVVVVVVAVAVVVGWWWWWWWWWWLVCQLDVSCLFAQREFASEAERWGGFWLISLVLHGRRVNPAWGTCCDDGWTGGLVAWRGPRCVCGNRMTLDSGLQSSHSCFYPSVTGTSVSARSCGYVDGVG